MTAGTHPRGLTTDLIRVMSRSERLDLARTIMANQRGLLAHTMTCMGLLATGYGLLSLTGHIFLQAAGVVGLMLSGIVGIVGYVRYRAMRRLLGGITAGHLLEVGLSLLKDEAGLAGNSEA